VDQTLPVPLQRSDQSAVTAAQMNNHSTAEAGVIEYLDGTVREYILAVRESLAGCCDKGQEDSPVLCRFEASTVRGRSGQRCVAIGHCCFPLVAHWVV
jgi:hypothetical protein